MFTSRLHPCGDITVLTMTDFEALLILNDDWSAEIHACEWTGEACRHRICGWSLLRRTDPNTFLLPLETGQMALAAEGA